MQSVEYSENTRITHIVKQYKRATLNPDSPNNPDSFVHENRPFGMSMIQPFAQPSFGGRRHKNSIIKPSFLKNPQIDYTQGSLMSFVKDLEDPFSAYIILQSFKFLCIMLQNI